MMPPIPLKALQMSDLDELPASERPLWWRLSHVCGPFGLSSEVMLAAVQAKQLPIRAQQFGERGLWYVNRADVLAYLRSIQEAAGAAL